MDLSVPIPRSSVRILGSSNVETCLKEFIKAERMEECGYKCQKCKGVDHFEKELTIFRLP